MRSLSRRCHPSGRVMRRPRDHPYVGGPGVTGGRKGPGTFTHLPCAAQLTPCLGCTWVIRYVEVRVRAVLPHGHRSRDVGHGSRSYGGGIRMLPCWAGAGTVGSILSLPHSIKVTVISRVDMWQLPCIPRTCAIQGSQGTYHSLDAQSWYYHGKGYDPQGPLWGAQVSFPCGYCCCNQKVNIVTWKGWPKNKQRSRGPPVGRGWLSTPFGQMCGVLALRL